MRSTIKRLLAAAAMVGIAATGAAAEDATAESEHKFEKAKAYHAQCTGATSAEFETIKSKIKAFTDAEIMAETLNDPEKLAALTVVINDPHTMHIMANCATEPVMWDTWMRGLSDPVKMMNAGARFMNPMVYFNWMMAPMNPAMYAPMFQMMNPAYYTTWTNAMMNPTFYEPFFAWMDPNWYTPRIAWMTDPASYQPMFNMFSMTAPVVPGQTPQQPTAPSEKTN